jgi:hypothetical protein
MKRLPTVWISALLLGALGAGAMAQIKSFTLEQMAQTADQAVSGRIVKSRVFRVDSKQDGSELYYTTLTIQGTGLYDSRPLTVDVTFRGGFISQTEGVFNSEAPAADDVKVGRHVVAFYGWTDDMGGNVPANTLIAAHGGLYRVVEGPRGATVLGRGAGYAVRSNQRVEQLGNALRLLSRK